MSKIAWIVNYYTDKDGLVPTEDDVIVIYLSKEAYEEKSFESLWRYKNFEKNRFLIDKFFMELRALSIEGYEFNFICEYKTRKEIP